MTTLANSPAPKPASLSDSKFDELKKKLRELFELDKSDLDFGIYRIMAAKNAEVNAFLDRQLKDVVRQTLNEHGAGSAQQVQAELDKAISQAQALGADPDTLPKVQQLRAKLASSAGASIAELEADIYNHLLAFFGRYYDEGDFISKRRYKGDTYAIPYSGEEVALHWANKDQYYIKSGEWHKDYRFKLPSTPGGNSGGTSGGTSGGVRFKLVDATAETGNNKEADNAKRRYVLVDADPVEMAGNELVLRFEFRVPTESQKQRAADGAVAIFGGKYATTTKGDEREQFCADAEKRALACLEKARGLPSPGLPPDAWIKLLTTPSPTDSKPLRTVLGRHLDLFTARNTFDYFIHKDLGGFLRRELDFYIKNEVVRLDDLESLDEGHLARVQGKIKALRRVASRVIDFLAAVENFQKKLWLKKKFVLQTHWLVTIDRIPAALRDVVAANQEQWAEWERLGFKPDAQEGQLHQGPAWGTRGYLDATGGLVVDTAFLGNTFAQSVLASDAMEWKLKRIDDAIDGVLIHSDSFCALSLLTHLYKQQVKCVYIDPPYNTGNDGFIYKDVFPHSSWATLIDNRLSLAKSLLQETGTLFVSIADHEQARLRLLLDELLGESGFLAQIIWQKVFSPKNSAQFFSEDHDYILSYAANRANCTLGILPRTAEMDSRFANSDNDPRGPWVSGDLTARNFYGDGTYPVTCPSGRVIASPPPGTYWRVSKAKMRALDEDNRIWWGADGDNVPRLKRFLSEVKEGRTPQTLWTFKEVSHTQEAKQSLLDMVFGEHSAAIFNTIKPIRLMRRIQEIAGVSDGEIVLDFFAGTGSTGHAAIELNRELGMRRRFILADIGRHFRTILLPRIAKALYSPDWKDGKAQVHGKGMSALVKYFALESYEDALNNLPAPTGELLAQADPATREALLTYSLDLELGPSLLNLDAFRDPWGYSINAQRPGSDEITRQSVDLVETFNYLIGLKVHAYGPIERYNCEFKRSKHAEGMGRLVVDGRLRKDADGPFVFHRVEGELNDDNGTRVLVVWRKLSGDAEQDAAALDAWMARHAEDTRQRSEHRDYHRIYINGPVTLAQPTAELRTVLPIEETFKNRMFEDVEGA
jgi:adenine-specific DNA-methyltransferase